VQHEWGGPDSADKRAWLAGAVADLFGERPDTDADDVEELLLQALEDEFKVVLEDGSERQVAAVVVRLRRETAAGEFRGVEELWRGWRERGGEQRVSGVRGGAEEEDEDDEQDDDDDDDDGDDDVDEDVEMDDAPALVSAPRRPEPDVDDDGFTKVARRKR
jgi:pre-rRNA-processing protein TSR2